MTLSAPTARSTLAGASPTAPQGNVTRTGHQHVTSSTVTPTVKRGEAGR
jgi:hypothetical protein